MKEVKWTFEKMGANLKDLNPKVREKAIEIARHLVEDENYTEGEAIQLAIKEAEEWFLDTQG